MSLFDFFVSFSNKLGLNNSEKSDKYKYRLDSLSNNIKSTNSFSPITINIDRELNIDSALSVLDKAKPKITKVTNFRTIKPEHGKVFLRRGIQIHHTKAFKLKYNGFLAQSDAKVIYAVTGTGNNDKWKNVRHIPMYKVDKGFEALVSYDSNDSNQENSENEENYINFAFKDPNNNWDNNSGSNYSFNIDLLTGNDTLK